jgi:membrane associated rhomboid family serine protease
MGIYDRDYYREDGNRWWSATGHRGTITLIAITVSCMFAYYIFVEQTVTEIDGVRVPVVNYPLQEYGAFHYPAVMRGEVWRIFTSFFISPFGFFSIVFGMLGLYWFGGEMETLYGTRRFVTFYVLAGVLANVGKFLLGLAGVGESTVTLGPSAPLFATFVLFAFHYPHRSIRIWFLLPIPVWVLVALYLGIQLLYLVSAFRLPGGAGVPYVIDPLFGAFVGFIYNRTGGRVFAPFEVITGMFDRPATKSRRASANLRLYDEDAPRPAAVSAVHADEPTVPNGKPPSSREAVDEYLEAKLDAVLEKVAKHGKGSLTAEENEILLKASEVFKRRRQ